MTEDFLPRKPTTAPTSPPKARGQSVQSDNYKTSQAPIDTLVLAILFMLQKLLKNTSDSILQEIKDLILTAEILDVVILQYEYLQSMKYRFTKGGDRL